MRQTAIGLSKSTWNPIRGCKRIDDSCSNCWAERIAGNYSQKGQTYYGIAKLVDGKPTWTGKVTPIQEHLYDPLDWDGRLIMVGTMTDLFYKRVSDAWRDRIFGIMALCPDHIFQVLTKRAQEMHDYFAAPDVWERIEVQARQIYFERIEREYPSKGKLKGPMRHTWLGVSVQDPETLKERCSLLQDIPAALRFVAAEPLLEQVSLGKFLEGRRPMSWVVAGGESGVDARPAAPAWMRSIRDECQAAAVPFFLHQWGAWAPMDAEQLEAYGWPGVQYVWPNGEMSVRMAKSDVKTMKGMATLDGVTWNQIPQH